MGSNNGELQDFPSRLVDKATEYEMEFKTEKSKIMTNSMNNTSADVGMNSQKLKEMISSK